MTLTTVIGSSGSGKTTFLNDLNKYSRGVYIRQYHQIRPYVAVTSIPQFDPTKLPYWQHYEMEGTATNIPVGGTMAGETTHGLSGGQRKMLLFELIVQRTLNSEPLLVVLDEPFAGVTDDFVPWIVDRLKVLRECHNVVLVTNDHVHALTDMADNTITVSALDRSKVKINQVLTPFCRQKTIVALTSQGGHYIYPEATRSNLQFFYDVEIHNSKAILAIFCFTAFFYGLFLATFWNSSTSSAAMVLLAGDLISFFSVNPYLLSLVDWRNATTEESEALMHSSRKMNKFLKSTIVVTLIFLISLVEYGMVNAVIDGLESIQFLLAIFFDAGSTTFPYVCFGIYTSLPHQQVETYALIPYMFLIFFSTTYSPGAGLPGVKDLRYLFSRFYFWCMVPGVQDGMEGCPADPMINMLLLVVTGLGTVLLFVSFFTLKGVVQKSKTAKVELQADGMQNDKDFQSLRQELYDSKNTNNKKSKQEQISPKIVPVLGSQKIAKNESKMFSIDEVDIE